MKVDKGARENLLSRAWAKFVKITDGYECRSYRRDCRKTLRVFPTKGLQSAARIICPSMTDKFHTGSLRGIFSHAHVARENDFISLPPAGGKLCEAFLHADHGSHGAFSQKRAMILWQGRFIALRKNHFSIRLVLEGNY